MNKATVHMTNWELYVYEGRYNLSGTADKHPVLGKNTYVSRTSSLVDYTYADDVLIYETRNTIYVCPLKYMSIRPYDSVVDEYREKLTHIGETSDNILDKIIAAAAKLSIEADPNSEKKEDYTDDELLNRIKELQKIGQVEIDETEQKEGMRLTEIACKYEDCVYIEVSSVECGNLLAYHLGENIGIVQPRLHSGMFQDSVLYMKYASEKESCSLDFRYWPSGWGDIMETYSWSDNIKQAVIKNETDGLLKFNNTIIQVGETMVFTPEGNKQGLVQA